MLTQVDGPWLFDHLKNFWLVFTEKVWLRVSAHRIFHHLSNFAFVITVDALKFLKPRFPSFQMRIFFVARIGNTNLSCVDFGVLNAEDVDLSSFVVCGKPRYIKHLFQTARRGIVVSPVAFTLSIHRLLNHSLSKLFPRLLSLITRISKSLVFDWFFLRLKQFNIFFFKRHFSVGIVLLIPSSYSLRPSFHLILKWLRPSRSICQITFFWTWAPDAKRLLSDTPAGTKLTNLSAKRRWCGLQLIGKRCFDIFNRSFLFKLRTRHHVIPADSWWLI